jgi:two-component system alkaline phosphatase synthesis response regulator PhoP
MDKNKKAKILIVEDEKNLRFLLTEILQEIEIMPVEILTAENGKTGLESIISEKPDIVFLDIMMPEIDGFEVARTVKKELMLKDVYIVLFTAKGNETLDKEKFIDCGADEYMIKPFDPEIIFDKAVKLLSDLF